MRKPLIWGQPWGWVWTFCWAILASLSITTSSSSSSNTNNHELRQILSSDHELTNFAVSASGEDVYVGGINVLYQVRWSNLSVSHAVKTGPVEDSVRCHASGDCPPDAVKKPTDNVNKVLVVDEAKSKLIVCGSVQQGICTRYSLGNISQGQPAPIQVAVAANDANSSTYAFVGPQRYNRWGQSDVLYVGTTFTTSGGDYRDGVPAVSSRHIERLTLAEDTFHATSKVEIDRKFRDRFLVKYIYGFNSTRHVYFVTVQKRSHLPGEEEKGYITRLARVCITDPNYKTYTEVTLECTASNGKQYNLAKDAFFTEDSHVLSSIYGRGRQPSTDSFLVGSFGSASGSSTRTGNSSAVCVFSLSHIEKVFEANIQSCLNGSVHHRNMEYISGPVHEGKCPGYTSGADIYDTCDVGLKISGSTPVTVEPYQMFSQSVTSLHFKELSSPEHQAAVLVMGTARGRLMVVLISPVSGAKLLTNYKLVERTAVSKVRLVDNHILALQSHSLTKVLASDCSKHQTCSTCVSANDPFCGWCAFGNRCTHLSDCSSYHNVSQWFSKSPGQCSRVEEVIPSSISVPQLGGGGGSSAHSTLTLVIPSLPKLPSDEHFVCVFANSSQMVVRANIVDRGLKCSLPLSETFKQYLSDDSRSSVALDVKMADLGTTLVSTRVPLLKCGRENSCQSCTAHSQCSWCMESNSCVARTSTQCYQSVRGSREGSPSPSCPLLKKSLTLQRVPNDLPVRLTLPFVHLPSFYHNQHSFFCLVHIEGAKFKVPARMVWDNSTVICDETIFKYNAPREQIEAEVSVVVNSDAVLDSKKVSVYKCSVLGSYKGSQDCTLCMSRRKSHGCTWCGDGCTSTGACPGASARNSSSSSSQVCPGPEIFMIRPSSGPLEGGTVLTIEGSNLGNSIQDVRGRIKIGNRDCSLLKLKNSVEATCLTPPVRREREMPVTLLSRQGQVQSSVRFKYMDFHLVSFSPSKGAVSGGTLLKIRGSNLDIGSKAMVYLDEVPCQVDSLQTTPNSIVCRTGFVPEQRVTQNLTVVIDGGVKQLRSPFFYTPDPVVHDIQPLKSFFSGGRILSVRGEFFDSVSSSNLIVYDRDGALYESSCHVYNARLMECKTPSVKKALEKRSSLPSSLSLRIGLKMDNVTSLLQLHNPYTGRGYQLLYVQDPAYANFTNSLKIFNGGDTLVIEGNRLSTAADENDVRVTIGDEYCNITSITPNQLLCRPPEQQPPAGSSDLPEVTVHVGPSLRYHLGYVQYNSGRGGRDDFMSSEIIGAIAAVTAVLVAVGIVVLIVMKHKSSQVEREYKRIQIQMDLLENNVRSECKQAFAELQTDITDLAAELETSGIPFVAHRKYVMNVFFPGVTDHPVLLKALPEWQASNSMFGFSMVQFEQLLLNKTFLITLIDTVERQPSFGIRDRVNLASLLSVVLMTKMDYFTEVLKTLLVRLMDRSLCSRHPQLMLRRTETVVEKLLTNWLALCMYDYIESRAGSSLFLLYKAIKCQIEKGPVDQFTQESKYALSDEGLLRESCDYSVVTCLVVQRELEEAYQAKVLDCDSITQVKSKILSAVYKNTPFSLRPPVQEIDLEWQCGQDAHVVLQDFDLTSKEELGLKRVNTLRHYGIRNKAVVSLVPRLSQHHQNTIHFGNGGSTIKSTSVGPPTNNIYEEIPSSSNNNPYSSNTLMNNHHTLNHHVMNNSQNNSSCLQPPGGGGGACYHLRVPDNLGMTGSSTGSTSTDRTGMLKNGKTIPEVYLTRLLSTKGTVKKFIDDFFTTILTVNDGSGLGGGSPNTTNTTCDESFPPAVKWLFDLFDSRVAFAGGGEQTEHIVHSWKSNSVPLRFWINMIKNPDFVFDVEKTPSTDLNLSIVAQTLMSACLTLPTGDGSDSGGDVLNKESPSHELLFARDIASYRRQIADFYDRVGSMPTVTDQDMHGYMNRLSQMHRDEFNQMAALKELFLYVSQYYHELSTAFNGSPGSGGSSVDSGNGTLLINGVNGTFVPSPTLSYSQPQPYQGTLHNHHQHNNTQAQVAAANQTNRDLSMKLEHIFKIVKESDYVR